MAIEKNFLNGATTLLILKLLESDDKYGYQMIEQLSKDSNETFNLKAGTLYPILHGLEKKGLLTSYEAKSESDRTRKYYSITKIGKSELNKKEDEWVSFSKAVNVILFGGGFSHETSSQS